MQVEVLPASVVTSLLRQIGSYEANGPIHYQRGGISEPLLGVRTQGRDSASVPRGSRMMSQSVWYKTRLPQAQFFCGPRRAPHHMRIILTCMELFLTDLVVSRLTFFYFFFDIRYLRSVSLATSDLSESSLQEKSFFRPDWLVRVVINLLHIKHLPCSLHERQVSPSPPLEAEVAHCIRTDDVL